MAESVNIPNMDEMYLTSLRNKWYGVDYLVEWNELIYVITKEEGDKTLLGCYTSNWWFNWENFWANEFWWDSISTQEYEWDTTAVFERKWMMVMCSVVVDTLITAEKSKVWVEDIVWSILAGAAGRLN